MTNAPSGRNPSATMSSPSTSPGDPAAPRLASSRAIRAICLVVGTVSLLLGVVGIVLPVLPTTPFLLLAAACYARGSSRLHRWLLAQPALGPVITEWRRSRSLAPKVKLRALLMVAVTFTVSIALAESTVLQLGLAATGAAVGLFLFRLPTTAT